MEFSIGDQIIHPAYGVGQIVDMEDLELVEGFEHYYVIEILDQGVTVRIPIRKMEDLGVRPVMSKAKLAQILETLSSMPRQLSEDFKTRQARVQEKLKTGRPLKIAEVVRDLSWRKRQAHLTKADANLLAQGQALLVTEMALVNNTEPNEAQETIDAALDVQFTVPT